MTRKHVMEFERPLFELEQQLENLRKLDVAADSDLAAEIEALAGQIETLKTTLYTSLTAWEKVQVSRHPERPRTQDYVEALFEDVLELRGDRSFRDDPAIFTALATFRGRKVAVVGHRKGKTTKENLHNNFGMAHPEGFRKALRVFRLAERFDLPVLTFVDTPGAYPGLEAEERGQAWAIAENLAALSTLRVPVVAVGIGEGGSGGALAVGFGDRLFMLENAYYSVITPEACASILHTDPSRAAEMASGLKLTAEELVDLGLCDKIVSEPPGGAHNDVDRVFAELGDVLESALGELAGIDPDSLVEARYARLRGIGRFEETAETS